jgi:hypothetical protein
VAKEPKGELVVVGFNYDLLETKVADKIHTAAGRIRERVKKAVEDIIEVGNDLLAVKESHDRRWLIQALSSFFSQQANQGSQRGSMRP